MEYKGGKCQKCGYSKSVKALHFHHSDPSKKGFTVGITTDWKRILKEIEKCELICANCRAEHHEQMYNKLIGDSLTYEKKVVLGRPRCKVCGVEINYGSTNCIPCSHKLKEKINWPNDKSLEEMVDKIGYSKVAIKLGVHQSSVWKRVNLRRQRLLNTV